MDSILSLQELPSLQNLGIGPLGLLEEDAGDGGSCTVCSYTCCCTSHD